MAGISRRVLRLAAISSGALLAGLAATWLCALAFSAVIPLDAFRTPVETSLSSTLGRQIHITGPMRLAPAIRPAVILDDIHIADPHARNGMDLLQARRLIVSPALFSLLTGRIGINRIEAHDVHISLVRYADNTWNWQRSAPQAASGHASTAPAPPAVLPWPNAISLHNLVLGWREEGADRGQQLEFDRLSGALAPGQPLEILVLGTRQHRPYEVRLTGGRLSDLLASTQPWHLQLGVYYADLKLLLTGKLDAPPGNGTQPLRFELEGYWPETTAILPGVRLTARQALEIRGRLAVSGSGLQVSGLDARLGITRLEGALSARFDTARPQITADLQIPVLDAAPLSVGRRNMPDNPPPRLPVAADVDAVIHVQEVINAPVDMHDARLGLSVRNGQLTAPLDIRIATVPFTGALEFAGQAGPPVMQLRLVTREAAVAGLADELTGLEGVRGNIGRMEIRVSLLAADAASVLNGPDIALDISDTALSYGHAPGARPVELVLDGVSLALPAGKSMTATARGRLLGVPFEAGLSAEPPVEQTPGKVWPVTMFATGAGARLGVRGSLAGKRGMAPALLDFELSGERLGDLSDWLGISPCAAGGYTARGQLVLSGATRRIQFLRVHAGETRLNGDIDWSRDETIPLLHVLMRFETLSPAEPGLLGPLMIAAGEAGSASGLAIDIPVLPQPVRITNADIDLAIAKMLLKPVAITDITVTGRIREGELLRSPFHAHIGNIGLQGHLDPGGGAADIVFELDADDTNPGNRLSELFGKAIRLSGRAATVPLQWLFRKALVNAGRDDCTDPG